MRTYYPRALVRLWILFFGEEERDALPLVFEPVSVTWRCNSDRKADECDIEVDARDLRGLDARGLYSVRVEVWCDNLAPGVSPQTMLGSRDALRFIGFVDEPEQDMGSAADSLRLKARDYTALLIDRQVPQNLVAPVGRGGVPRFRPKTYGLDRTYADFVQEILRDAGGEADLYRTSTPGGRAAGAAASTLGSALAGATGAPGAILPQSVARAGAEASLEAMLVRNLYIEPSVAGLNLKALLLRDEWAPDGSDSLWDVLSQVSDLLGVVPTFDRDWLWIKKASDYHAGLYHMAYGQNLLTLKFTKNLTSSVSRKVFEIRCLNPAATRPEDAVIYGVWPPNSLTKYQAPVNPNGGTPAGGDASYAARGGSARGSRNTRINDVVVRFIVDGDYSQAMLTDMARTYYEEARRQDIQGEFTTSEMVDLGFAGGFPQAIATDPQGPRALEAVGWTAAPPPTARQVRPGDALRARPSTPSRRDGRRLQAPPVPPQGASPPAREPTSLLGMRNSSLVVVDVPMDPAPPDPLRDPWAPTQPAALRDAVWRSRIAGASAIKALYVREAEHRWSADTGYEMTCKFTAVLGTDVGGPTTGGRSDAEITP